jgi:hypothetical protein
MFESLLNLDIFKIFYVILQGKQGIVRHVYQGIVFLCDENEEENGGYVIAKAIMCEKVKLAVSVFSVTGKV